MEQEENKMSAFLLGAVRNALGRLPDTPYDLTKVKRLDNFYSIWADEASDMVAEGDFSCIGKMPNLHTLIFSNARGERIRFVVNDFSFLADCKKVRTLNLSFTNFSDCRLLLEMPALCKVFLPEREQLVHMEALDVLVERGVQVALKENEPCEELLDVKTDTESLLKITQAIKAAVKSVLLDLFLNQEHYYYITLVSDGGAGTPCISAWSHEALARSAENNADREMIKWSYADSPYCCHRQENFAEVERLLSKRPDIWSLEDAQYESEYEKRYMAMEEAIRQLDKEGLFTVTQARGEVVVLVETMPPDEENTLRAFRLNRKGSKMFQKWLEEAAE